MRLAKGLMPYLTAFVAALALAVAVRAVVVSPCRIMSGSMEPTLLTGDWVLVNELAYGLRLPFMDGPVLDWAEPKRGDIIVFRAASGGTFVKRVVGLPGELVEIRDKRVLVGGKALDEPYATFRDPRTMPVRDSLHPVLVPGRQVFVLGDNRDRSTDSRFRGFVHEDKILGRATVVYWSASGDSVRWKRMGTLVR